MYGEVREPDGEYQRQHAEYRDPARGFRGRAVVEHISYSTGAGIPGVRNPKYFAKNAHWSAKSSICIQTGLPAP